MKLVAHHAHAAEVTSEPDSDGWPFAIALAVLGPIALVLTAALALALLQ